MCVVGGYWDPKDASLKTNLNSSITVNSGEFYYLLGFSRKKSSAGIQLDHTGTSHITVNGGAVNKIFGGTSENHYGGSTVININGGAVAELHTAGDVTRRLKGSATVNLNGGRVTTVDINNVMGDVKLNIAGVSPGSVAVTYASDTLKADEEKAGGVKSVSYNSLVCSQTVINSFSKNFDIVENTTVVFVRAGATGDGTAPDKALGSFADAYNKLKVDGGKIVIVGEVAYNVVATDDKFGGEIIVEGQDDKSALKLSGDVSINADTTFEKIRFTGSGTLYASFHELILKPDVSCNGDVTLVGSTAAQGTGNVSMIINGGTFYQSIYAVYEEDSKQYKADYDITLTLNGGTFYQMVAPACSFTIKLEGKYTVYLNGGNYDHLTDMLGTELFKGNMTSSIKVAPSANATSQVVGTDTFTNPVRGSGPDPWVFYYDGSYYYTHTTGTKIVLMKVQNFSDIDTSAERVIIEPTEGQNMWSPEIHHFSAEEVGEENAGWYLYIGFDDGTTANQRQHVLKCLDGDNLLGRWGDPVTGKVNVQRKVEVPNAPHYNVDELCGGSSKIVINGKTYMTFISEVGRGTADFHQTVNITEIENPWTYKSVPTTICVPTYKWEEGGYGYSETKQGWYPKVVEGASAVYSDNGDVYLMYTGSGYWTIYYQLGYLKFLGGDPMDASNWKKNPTPVFSLSDEVNGCGHGSYFKDHEGNYYVAYHGYIGKDTSSGRYAHIERI